MSTGFELILGLREELYHPLTVHFPIALLVMAFFLSLVLLFWADRKWEFTFQVVFYSGIFFYGITLFTGDIAAEVTKFQIQQPLSIQAHEDTAYIALYLYMLALAVEILRMIRGSSRKIPRVVIALILAAATGYLARTSHQGAMLVYEQGAAVQLAD